MNRNLFVPAIIVLWLPACRPAENVNQLKAVNKSLEFSNVILADGNRWAYEDLEGKLKDPQTQEVASIWQPRAERIKVQVDSIREIIDNLKKDLSKQSEGLQKGNAPLVDQLAGKDGPAQLLFNKLAAFKNSIPVIMSGDGITNNPYRQENIKREIVAFNKVLLLLNGFKDSLSINKQQEFAKTWQAEHFTGSSSLMTMIALNKIENDVLGMEKAYVDYCNNNSISYSCDYYRKFQAIATVSSSYVKKGDSIEVYAGIGAFSNASKPTYIINGQEIKPGYDEMATYCFKANGAPGKHTVPVTIKFCKPDGTMEKVTKIIAYTIAP